MLAATGFAIAALLLARLTMMGPGAALHSSLAVAATGSFQPPWLEPTRPTAFRSGAQRVSGLGPCRRRLP